MTTRKILITGGAGFIGSAVNVLLHENGYDTVIYDNLSTGKREAVTAGTLIEGDLLDRAALKKVFTDHKFDAVMHFAAAIDIGESFERPLFYYQNNVAATINLLQAMSESGTNIFIFSSSAGVYGAPDEQPITETEATHPINPYGQTKLQVEQILSNLPDIRSCSLRYFNAAGGDPKGLTANYKTKEHNLIPLALRSLMADTELTLFGTDYPTADGTCVRDYVHIYDIAQAHITAMEQLFEGAPTNIYNLGSGKGFSNREVLDTIEKVTGKKVSIKMGSRRRGDPAILVADASKAKKELGWQPQYPTIDEMVSHAFKALENALK